MISFSSIGNMFRLLLLKVNNSMSIMSDSNIENHGPSATHVVTTVGQEVEHGFIKFYGKQCSACCHES